MMMFLIMRFFLLCGLFLLPLHVHGQELPPKFDKVFNAERFVLNNGLEVIVVPNNRAPVVTHMIWYRVGAADEPAGKSGIAHFLEHLMFKGHTLADGEEIAPGEFSRIVRKLGGNDNAFTSYDYTAYFQSIAVQHLERMMEIEAGRMRGINPPREEVESERKVILEERRQRTDNDPRGRFQEKLRASLFINHPYGQPVIGWYHEMEQLDWQTAKSFYDRYYAPNNAVLIVSGDVTGEEVRQLALKTYGDVPKSAGVPDRKWPQSPSFNGRTLIEFEHPTSRQPEFHMILRAPSASQNAQESLAFQVLEEIMGSGQTSRLYRALVIENKLASSAGMFYSGNALDGSIVYLYATPLPGVSMEDIDKALEVELEKIVTGGVSEDELKTAKERLISAAIYARDSLSGPAMIIGRAITTGSSLEDIENWPKNINAVTAEQIQGIARKYLDLSKGEIEYVRGHLYPKKTDETHDSQAFPVEEGAL